MTEPYVIFGAGRAAEIMLLDIKSAGLDLPLGFLVDAGFRASDTLQGLPVSEHLSAFENHQFIAAVARPPERRDVVNRLIGHGLTPGSAAASAFDASVTVGQGAFISRNVILDSFCSIGQFAFLRNGCFVGHDTIVEEFCYVAPRASIGGSSVIGSGSFVGMGAVIRPGARIGSECLIGAGAYVYGEVRDRTVVRADGQMKQMDNPMSLLAAESSAL